MPSSPRPSDQPARQCMPGHTRDSECRRAPSIYEADPPHPACWGIHNTTDAAEPCGHRRSSAGLRVSRHVQETRLSGTQHPATPRGCQRLTDRGLRESYVQPRAKCPGNPQAWNPANPLGIQ
ncbi:hypothetical protein BPORC_1853 [Bifidobacterium porcinum]|nr:hypothetical protein BPORC_1853 [Bifidobacterium porcinum]